jgi:hypothetical protein
MNRDIHNTNTRDTHIAVKSERAIPIRSASPKPLMSDTPKINNTMAEVIEVRCESQIAVQDFSNPRSVARANPFPSRIASFIRSKISTFASIANPIERITPAIPERVNTTQKNLRIESIRNV